MRNGTPASRIFALARASRWPIAAGETRNAEAIAAASRPRIVCSISGARTASSIAGCAQANISARRRSGIGAAASAAACSSSPIEAQRLARLVGDRGRAAPASIIRRRRASRPASLRDLRARRGAARSASAAANASDSASSAPATSRSRRGEKGDELAVAFARDPRRAARARSSAAVRHIGQIGRTSIAPCSAPGQRAAQPIAASRSGASMT